MHFEHLVGLSREKFMALLEEATANRFSISPQLSKTFRGEIDGFSYNISYNGFIKGIRPGLYGTVIEEGPDECLLVADTYLQPFDILLSIIFAGLAIYNIIAAVYNAELWNYIPFCFFTLILLLNLGIYRLRRKYLIKKITDLPLQLSESEALQDIGFINGRSTLNEVELRLLGDVSGKFILHLQCHFGQDTLSLARLGAKATGIDFSPLAIQKAQELNELMGLDADFICSDVYELPAVLDKQYDIVYTSYGTIGWLPDMERWAQIVARYLKPGGKFVFVEFHPVVWMFSYDFKSVQYSYFNKEAIIETLSGTYADRDAASKKTEIGWNHDLSEVMQSLINAGLGIETFSEYDYSPYNCFANTVETAPGKYQVVGMEGKIPMLYSITAVR